MKQKGSALLLIPVIIVLILSGIGWFLIKNKQITILPWGQTQPTSTPTSSQTPIGDLTNWKTYRNEKDGFELKYPIAWNQYDTNDGASFVDNNGLGQDQLEGLVISIILSKENDVNFLDTQSFYNKLLKLKGTDNQGYTKLGEEIINTYKAVKYSYDAPPEFPQGIYKVAYMIDKIDSFYTIYMSSFHKEKIDIKLFDQILSTFKFIDNKETKYTCPEGEWIDCMPILTEEAKKACSSQALEWYKKNCPNFKGVAQ